MRTFAHGLSQGAFLLRWATSPSSRNCFSTAISFQVTQIFHRFGIISGRRPTPSPTFRVSKTSLSPAFLRIHAGEIPKELGNLPNLTRLDLDSNQLTGNVGLPYIQTISGRRSNTVPKFSDELFTVFPASTRECREHPSRAGPAAESQGALSQPQSSRR